MIQALVSGSAFASHCKTSQVPREFRDDLAANLVDWCNSVDTSYQTHLRDELNRERFRETIRVEIRAQLAELKREHDSKRNFDQIMLAGFLGMLFIEALLYWAVLSG